MKRKAEEYGHLVHIAARSDDGLVVINLWESEEGSQQAWEDPELQEARTAAERNGASAGDTTFEHYEVEDYRRAVADRVGLRVEPDPLDRSLGRPALPG